MAPDPERHPGTPEPPARPSDAAVGRLGASLRGHTQDLRVRIEEGLLRSELLLEAGLPDAAAEVLAEQQELVARFRADLEQDLAGAAVELAAERVLAGAPGWEQLDPVEEDAVATDGTDADRLRLLPTAVSTVLSAVAAVAFVVMVATPPEPSVLEAGASGRDDVTAAPTAGATDGDVPRDSGDRFVIADDGVLASPDRDDARADVRRWFVEQRDLLSRLGVPPRTTTSTLADLEDLVVGLLPGGALAEQLWGTLGLDPDGPTGQAEPADGEAAAEPAEGSQAADGQDGSAEGTTEDDGERLPFGREGRDDASSEPADEEGTEVEDPEADPAADGADEHAPTSSDEGATSSEPDDAGSDGGPTAGSVGSGLLSEG